MLNTLFNQTLDIKKQYTISVNKFMSLKKKKFNKLIKIPSYKIKIKIDKARHFLQTLLRTRSKDLTQFIYNFTRNKRVRVMNVINVIGVIFNNINFTLVKKIIKDYGI